MCTKYTLARTAPDRYRFDRHDGDQAQTVALILQVRDRTDRPTGWRLKPLVMMRGAPSHVWPTPAEALASTRLMKPSEAEAAVERAEHVP